MRKACRGKSLEFLLTRAASVAGMTILDLLVIPIMLLFAYFPIGTTKKYERTEIDHLMARGQERTGTPHSCTSG